MTSIRKQTITRWLAITAGACLISYAAQAPALMATLSALQALEVYDANTMPFIIGFALLVAMGSGFWLARQSRTATIIEYSTLTAAILFITSAIVMALVTLWEMNSGQNATDPAGPALGAAIAAVFVAGNIAQGAICLTIGLVLRRKRRLAV